METKLKALVEKLGDIHTKVLSYCMVEEDIVNIL